MHRVAVLPLVLCLLALTPPPLAAQSCSGDQNLLECEHFNVCIYDLPDSVPPDQCQQLDFDGASNRFPFSVMPGLDVEGGTLMVDQPLNISGNRNPLSGSVEVCPMGSPGPTSISLTWIVTNPPGRTVQERCRYTDQTSIGAPSSSTAPTDYSTVNTYALADPVSLATGELHPPEEVTADLQLGGPLPLSFVRYYASFLAASDVSSALGTNWMHNFDLSLAVSGDTAAVTLFGGRTIEFTRNGNNWDLASTEKLSHQLQGDAQSGFRYLDLSDELTYSFDDEGRLQQIADRNGNTLNVTPSLTDMGPAMVEDGRGRSLTFEYANGMLMRVEDQTGRGVDFLHTGANLTTARDPNGGATTYEYATGGALEGLMTMMTRPDGSVPTRQTYDADGRVASQTDGNGNVTTFSYPAAPATPNRSSATDADNQTTEFTHEGFNNLTGKTYDDGATQAFEYDASNRLTSYTNGNGQEATFSYHAASGYFAGSRDFRGRQRQIEYQEQTQDGFSYWVHSRLTYPDGTSQRMEFDAAGNMTLVVDRDGGEWGFAYNDSGQVVTATNPMGGVTTYAYNADGTLASMEAADGSSATLGYDELKRLNQVRLGDGSERSYTYDANDNVLTQVDESGQTTAGAFDEADRFVAFTDRLGGGRQYAYDGNDRRASITDGEGNTSTYGADANGRLVEFRNGAGEMVRLVRDSAGRVTDVRDALGSRVRFAYDEAGRLISSTDGLGATRTLTLDPQGAPTRAQLPGGQVIEFSYDSMGRLVGVNDPLGRQTTYERDAKGMVARMDRSGVAASFERNAMGELTKITDPNGGEWMRGYGASGRLASVTDPLGRTVTLGYDSRGLANRIETPVGTTEADLNGFGQATERRMSDGTTVSFQYDNQGQLVAGDGLTLGYNGEGWITQSNGLTMTRDGVQRIQSLELAPGKVVRYEYDARGRPTKITDHIGGETVFGYDVGDRLAMITRPNGVTTEFTYDVNDRLTAQREVNGAELASIRLTRDDAGQITSAERNLPVQLNPAPGVLSSAYDAAHQMNGATYDGLGRLTAAAGQQYGWDVSSRLTSVSGPGGESTYGYDALGQRISRTAGGTTTEYVLNYGLPSIAVSAVRSGGTDQRYYVHTPMGTLLYSIDASDDSRSFYHFDEMGHTTLLTDDSGAVTDSYSVSPYGEQIRQSGSSTQPFIYHGAFGVMREPGSELYYMRARYYDGDWGRFLSRDPIMTMDPLAINPYQFVNGNPLLYIDPSGQQAMKSGGLSFTQPPTANSCPTPLWSFPLTNTGGLLRQYGNFRIAPYLRFANGLDDWINAIVNGAPDVARIVNAFNPSAAFQEAALTGRAAFDPRYTRWIHMQGELGRLQQQAASASRLRNLGTGLAVAGIGLDAGLTIYDGVTNGDSAGTIVLDTSATVGGDVAVLAGGPVLAVADLATGGSVSGGITNVAVGGDACIQMATGRFTPSDAANVRRRMTRKPGLRVVWNAGESWSERGVGGTFTALGQAFGLID